jgi:hypothetical protein
MRCAVEPPSSVFPASLGTRPATTSTTRDGLFRETEEKLELEASFAAAMLIFQGDRFHARALDYENSIKTPKAAPLTEEPVGCQNSDSALNQALWHAD